jgi:hypothetical protein
MREFLASVQIQRTMKGAAAISLLLLAGCATPRANFPVFGPGPLTNLQAGNDGATTNASLHALWALAIPAAGRSIDGRRGALVCGGAWIAASLVGEAFFHAPENPGPGYTSEVRTDLLTKIVPTLAFLLADAIWGGASH